VIVGRAVENIGGAVGTIGKAGHTN
jgi:hypothetical protein